MVTRTENAILDWLGACADDLDRLTAIDRRGRVMLTFMSAHMKETTGPLGVSPADYFRACYTDVGQEFFQAAENSFVTHHALRVLFVEWMEALGRLPSGAVGRRLAEAGAPLPELSRTVAPEGKPIVPFEYEKVRESLRAGKLPPPPKPDNPMMRAEACTLFARGDTMFGELELQSARDWAEEAAILWTVVRRTIALERTEAAAAAGAEARPAVARLVERYEVWRELHLELVRLHVELFSRFSGGMFEFVGQRFGAWTISPVLLRDLYLEVAQGVAALRGEAARLPQIPEPRYWRRTPWSPAEFGPGRPGLPPF